MFTTSVISLRPWRSRQVRPTALRPSLVVQPSRRSAAARDTPQPDNEEKSALETAIDDARRTCEIDSAGRCASAWDDVEKIAAKLAHKRAAEKPLSKPKSDPLEEIYDD